MKLTYIHDSVLLIQAIAERQSEVVETLDKEAVERGDYDTPLDEDRVVKIAHENILDDLDNFWFDDTPLEDFEEYPWLHRYLERSLTRLKETIDEKGLKIYLMEILPMGSLKITFEV